MRRNIFALTGAAAALSVGASWAQQTPTSPEPPSSEASAQSLSSTAPLSNDDSEAAPAPAATPIEQPASATTSSSITTTTTSTTAATPSASDTAVTVSGSSGAVFKAEVGSYPMSHYRSPPRPIPYEQLHAYLSASPSQQLARNWWAGTELAETPTAAPVAATVPSASTAGIPGDTDVSLQSDTQAPVTDVQRQLDASGLSGTPVQGRPTAPPNDALTPGAPAAEGLPEPTP
jgi:trimeric autotransporter adhesin